MHDDDRKPREGDYRTARIGAASGFATILILLLVIDAVSADYEIAAFTVTALLVAVLTLLGLEVSDIIRGR